MTPYIIVYIFYFMVVGAKSGARNQRIWFFLASVPMIGLVFLRRDMIGVDIPMYELSIDAIRVSGTYTYTFEPLFEYAIRFLSLRISDSSVVLAVFSALTTLLLYWGSYRIERKPFLLAFCIVPYFYLDMTMNGIRYGLAFSMVVCGAQFLIKGRRYLYFFLAVAASLIQLSSVILAIMLLMLIEKRWRMMFVAIVWVTIIYYFSADYLQLKFDANKSLEAQSITSGLAPLLLSMLTLAAFWFNRNFKKVAAVQILILGAFSIGGYVLTQFTYAGLRIQLLNLFLIFVFCACIVNIHNIKINKKTVLVILLIGLVGAIFRLKNFYSEAGQGDAPFAPYYFIWEN